MRNILITLSFFLIPGWAYASPCSEFVWHHPAEMIEPEVLKDARHAMTMEHFSDARAGFQAFLHETPEGNLAEGARFALASLPDEQDELDSRILNIIDRLRDVRKKFSKGPYAAWALCREGELSYEAGWTSESKEIFEEFLSSYSDHPLAGAVLVNTGNSYLATKQYLEAALVFRRVLDAQKWSPYHVDGALGLANATAASQVWEQAYYWFQTVEAEDAACIRKSAESSYAYALTERTVGDSMRAIDLFLTTYNLHSTHIEAGHALIHIGMTLRNNHEEMLALWFFHEAALHYPKSEPGRRGEAELTKWVVSYLMTEHSQEEWGNLYDRLDALDIYLMVSWDGVLEVAQNLSQAPETDLSDQAKFWLGQGYQELEDRVAAVEAYTDVVLSAHEKSWSHKAQDILSSMVLKDFQERYEQQAWVKIVQYHDSQKDLLAILPPDKTWMAMLAESYHHIRLPEQALKWYDKMLDMDLAKDLQEEVYYKKVRLADEIGGHELIRKMADTYRMVYQEGKWKGDVALIVGLLDIQEDQHEQALQEFTVALEHVKEDEMRTRARRERARTFAGLGKRADAINDYRHMVTEQTATLGDRLSLAGLLYREQQFADAAGLYQPIAETASLAEAKAWAKFRLALCYEETGQLKESADLLAEVSQAGEDLSDVERTIGAAAAAVLDEFVQTKGTS